MEVEVLWFAAGVFVGVIILAVFDGVRMWDQHMKMCDLEVELFESKEQVTHLRARTYPNFILNDDGLFMLDKKQKERIYTKYEDLVEPGTTTLGPFGLEDNDA